MSRLGDAGGADGADDERPIPPDELRAWIGLQAHVLRACAEGLAVLAAGHDPAAKTAYRALLELAQRLREVVELRLEAPPPGAASA